MIDTKGYLVSLPSRLGFKDGKAIAANVYRALYVAATNDGADLPSIFPHTDLSQFHPRDIDPTDKAFGLGVTRDSRAHKVFSSSAASSQSYFHLRHRICARLIGAGEPLYRCVECGFDDTCVLCCHCFNPEDHRGHDVRVSISSGTTGGLCDCSDPEAFPTTLNCLCAEDTVPESSSKLSQSIEQTMSVALDYVLDVLSHSIGTLPAVQEAAAYDEIEQFSDISDLPYYSTCEDRNFGPYVLVLWNDERHNFPEAQAAIKAATDGSDTQCFAYANQINEEGRAILRTDPDPMRLVHYHKKIKETSSPTKPALVSSICSARDYMREEIVIAIFGWIKQIIAHPTIGVAASQAFARLLLDKDYWPSGKLMQVVSDRMTNDNEPALFTDGLLWNGAIKPMLPKLNDRGTMIYSQDEFYGTRLQYLLAYEIRLTKQVRSYLPTMLTSSLIAEPQFKSQFAEQVAAIFPMLFTIQAVSEREEGLAVLPEIAVQLWTCPVTIQHLVTTNKIGLLIAPCVSLINTSCSERSSFTGDRTFKSYRERDNVRNHQSFAVAMVRHMSTVAKMTSPEMLDQVSLSQSEDLFDICYKYLKLFQGFSPVLRKLGDHVEWDMFRAEDYFAIVDCVLSFANNFAQNIQANGSNVSVKTFAEKLSLEWINIDLDHRDHAVSGSPVNLINAIQTFLGWWLTNNFTTVTNCVAWWSVRSIVFAAQARVGLWVRNGSVVSKQTSAYLSFLLEGDPYFQDLYVCQSAIVGSNPTETLSFFLHIWELSGWFYYNDAIADTVYETDRFDAIVERFIQFLYVLFVDRTRIDSYNREEELQWKIAYTLADEPRAYSVIKRHIHDAFNDFVNFDNQLRHVAEYAPPKGLSDSGKYRLKDSWMAKLDPMSKFTQSGQFDTISAHQRQLINAKNPDEVVLTPQVYHAHDASIDASVAQLAYTPTMFKLLQRLLSKALADTSETFLPQLLRYIHVIVLDLNSAEVDPETLIPVALQLAEIVNRGEYAKPTTATARHLVGFLRNHDQAINQAVEAKYPTEASSKGQSPAASSKETEAERRKRKAEERKNRVMAKFKRQQQDFVANNQELVDESPAPDDNAKGYQCVQCNEAIRPDDVFGILYEKVNLCTTRLVSPDPEVEPQGVYGEWHSEGVVSCGHHIHEECYRTARRPNGEVKCAMCRTVQHNFAQMWYPHSAELSAEPFTKEAVCEPSVREVLARSQFQSADNFAGASRDAIADQFCDLMTLLAGTVRMYESAQRDKGEPDKWGLWDYPASAKQTIRVLLQEVMCKGDSPSLDTEYLGVFERAILYWLFHQESWPQVVKKHACKLIVEGIIDMEKRVFVSDVDRTPAYVKLVAAVRDVVGGDRPAVGSMEPYYYNFVRQAALFYDLVATKYTAEGHFESTLDHSTSDIASLCDLLGLPDYATLIHDETELAVAVQELRDQLVFNSGLYSMLEYAGPRSFIELPSLHANSLEMVGKMRSHQLRSRRCCLLCGVAVSIRDTEHVMTCGRGLSVGYVPSRNVVIVQYKEGREMKGAELPGPYVTEHGEIKSITRHEPAVLSQDRLNLLHKMYLTHELEGYLSRNDAFHDWRRWHLDATRFMFRPGQPPTITGDEDDTDDEPQQVNIPQAWPVVLDDDEDDEVDHDDDWLDDDMEFDPSDREMDANEFMTQMSEYEPEIRELFQLLRPERPQEPGQEQDQLSPEDGARLARMLLRLHTSRMIVDQMEGEGDMETNEESDDEYMDTRWN
ncbi:hypothetical protein DIURU_001153 [Diutina rugosa]|uniref:E3 ubiquitin-protein ligase n=1 Tax=Diutina rugosa TaxID=5481 RepID=A0A642UVL1_DIURU|nr:uncharacterized protein DIURU_001153 [Diutina rugosa]KAA8906211.1 hypothetical protein DIURU_001153 [Diutina rugosa]